MGRVRVYPLEKRLMEKGLMIESICEPRHHQRWRSDTVVPRRLSCWSWEDISPAAEDLEMTGGGDCGRKEVLERG